MSSSPNPEIADDLLTEIFLLLPIKSLIRFQSVSKLWQSLIADPQFRHTRNSNLNPPPLPPVALIFPITNDARGISRTYAYLVPLHKKSSHFRKLNFNHTPASPWDIKLMSSCNGLLLLAVKESYSSSWDHYICNPTTDKYSKLPKTGEKIDWLSKTQDRMCLAFDPSNSRHYKVVCVHQLRGVRVGDDRYKFFVYSSETGSWKKRGQPFTAKDVDFEKGVYWNGAVKWRGSLLHDNKSICFNPDVDKMPRVLPGSRDLFDTDYWVYEMSRNCCWGYWYEKYRAHLPRLIFEGGFTFCCHVWGKNNDNDDDDSFLVFNIWGSIVRFNVVDKTIELVHKFKVTDIGGYNLVHGRDDGLHDRESPGAIYSHCTSSNPYVMFSLFFFLSGFCYVIQIMQHCSC